LAAALFFRDRLKAALPRLKERLEELRKQEYLESWLSDYEEVKLQRDALAEEFRSKYLVLSAQLVDLLTRMVANDAVVSRINGRAPSGVRRYLREAELEARGLDQFWTHVPSIAKELRLPDFEHSSTNAWPPPQRPFV
jgi:hypothetical protein